MFWDSVAHFTTFNLKVASATRHPVPKSVVSHSFGGMDIHLIFVEECLYHCGNKIGLLKTKKFSLIKNISVILSSFHNTILSCKYFSLFPWP